ncbi:MAG: D-alanine--D-alanine ligase family protein [Nitrospinota bacterium]
MSPGREPCLNFLLLFGGRSTEHEVSRASAESVSRALRPERYRLFPLYITPEGGWHLVPEVSAPSSGERAILSPEPGGACLISPSGGKPLTPPLDVAFPLLHGTFGEDGTVQGLLELAELPFIGSGTAASAAATDKALSKLLFRASGIPILDYKLIHRAAWERDRKRVLEETLELPLPLFVKPSSLGSSVGVSRVDEEEKLEAAIEHAFGFDAKVLVEVAAEGREVECSLLEEEPGLPPLASPIAEIVPKRGFYDYEAKYTPGLTEILIPASLPEEVAEGLKELSRRGFMALGCSGLARADFFYREDSGEVFLNEINSMPGFTELSVYPRLFEEAGIPYPELIDRLVEVALKRARLHSQRRFRRGG